AAEPDNGLHAFYTSKSGFAVRYGQRALGMPADQVLPWPERLQRLFTSAHNPELQQLVEEDRRLTPPEVANPVTPVLYDYPELDEGGGDEPAPGSIRPPFTLPARSQNYEDTTQPGRYDSKKLRA